MTNDPAALADTYIAAWKGKDFDTLRSILADDVTFAGPFAQLDNADDCVQGLRGMSEILTDIVVTKRWVDGDDVITWFDLHTSVAEPVPTVNWSHVEGGRITSIRALFDPRPLLPPGKE
jgi:SnoaL-like domain